MKVPPRKIALILAFFFFATGCATTHKYETMLDSWVGSDIDQIVVKWGPPDRTFKLKNGQELYAWHRNERVESSTYYAPGWNLSSSRAHIHYCQTIFTVDGNKVISWRHEGDSCRSR